MFHKTSLRLTGLYLLIIMVISVFFSINVYQLSIREINRGYHRQGNVIDNLPVFDDLPLIRDKIENAWASQLDEARTHVINQLILVNLVILVAGGLLSYYLARMSLDPIEEAHRAQSRFTADASHELRTPISAMQSEIEVSLLDPKLTLSMAKKQLNSNLEELQNLANLTNGLLRLARLDNSNEHHVIFSVSDLIASATKKIKNTADEKNVKIVKSLDSKLKVNGDKSGLSESLLAVLDNAVKYSPENSTVMIESSRKHNTVIVKVADEGPGIKPKDLEHIFERFYRADQSRGKLTHGYGLGLSIARDIVELHGGNIKARNRGGKGTTIEITIPAA